MENSDHCIALTLPILIYGTGKNILENVYESFRLVATQTPI